MEAGGDEQRNVDLRIPAAQLLQHGRENIAAGNQTCVVADDDRAGPFAARQFLQMQRIDWSCHGSANDFKAALRASELIDMRGQHCGVRQLTGKRVLAIGDMYCHLNNSP